MTWNYLRGISKESKKNPSVSVALCTYNGAMFLPAQLDSILAQHRPADEIIIVDDCSTDGTLDIIREYANRTDTIRYFVNDRNLGYVQNFSKAISKTGGDFVALSDQDDIWTPDHLEVLLNSIGENAVCVGDALMINAEGDSLGMNFSDIKQNYYIPEGNIPKAYRIIYNYNPYQGASILINRKWVEDYLPFPAEAGFHDTFLAGCACFTQGLSVIPNVITHYRMHEGQVSSKWKVRVFDEVRHKHHHICFPSKLILIDALVKKAPAISSEALAFIEEFHHILELDRAGRKKRAAVLRILNQHYKEIHSCWTDKYIVLRSLHFLLSF